MGSWHRPEEFQRLLFERIVGEMVGFQLIFPSLAMAVGVGGDRGCD